jgi:hypothetical protein
VQYRLDAANCEVQIDCTTQAFFLRLESVAGTPHAPRPTDVLPNGVITYAFPAVKPLSQVENDTKAF